MATNNQLELQKLFKATDKIEKLKEFYLSKKLSQKVAKAVIVQIRKRTRLGYGAVNGKRYKLDQLSDGYVKQRANSRGELSSQTKPNKSNLTFTGSMLDNLEETIRKSIESSNIFISGGSGLDKNKIQWVSEQRPFLSLTKAEKRLIQDLVFEEVKKEIKKLRLKT